MSKRNVWSVSRAVVDAEIEIDPWIKQPSIHSIREWVWKRDRFICVEIV